MTLEIWDLGFNLPVVPRCLTIKSEEKETWAADVLAGLVL
jgi:hypothetical protein